MAVSVFQNALSNKQQNYARFSSWKKYVLVVSSHVPRDAIDLKKKKIFISNVGDFNYRFFSKWVARLENERRKKY